jgi:hypothetical protein
MTRQFINNELDKLSNSFLSRSLLSKVAAESQGKDSNRLCVVMPEFSSVSNNADRCIVVWNVARSPCARGE